MVGTARARTHALCIVGFRLWRPSAPLKGGSFNEQQVRLDDGEEGVEAVFNPSGLWLMAARPIQGLASGCGRVLDERQEGRVVTPLAVGEDGSEARAVAAVVV